MQSFIFQFVSLLFSLGVMAYTSIASAAPSHVEAFKQFVETGQFQQANFYLRQGYVQKDELDTSQIYFRIIVKQMNKDIGTRNDAYQYLNALAPIDLNRQFLCLDNRGEYKNPCYLVNLLAHGRAIAKFHFFAQRGLNLNAVYEDSIPASFHIINRLGTRFYSLANLNQLTEMGMIFGDELYDPTLMTDLDFRNITLPLETGAITAFNFMDTLTISLANLNMKNRYYVLNNVTIDGLALSRRDELMCSFISHSASKFTPSFDYLSYLFDQRPNFRAENLNATPEKNSNVYYRAFPHACVQLISALARSHPKLQDLVSKFAASGDVATAQWLLNFQQQR